MFSRDFQLDVAVLEILLDLILIKNVLKKGLAERFHDRNNQRYPVVSSWSKQDTESGS